MLIGEMGIGKEIFTRAAYADSNRKNNILS